MQPNCITDLYLFGILADLVLLLAMENDIHHIDNIFQKIISIVCFSKGRTGFSKKVYCPGIKVFVSLYYDHTIFYPMKNTSRTSELPGRSCENRRFPL